MGFSLGGILGAVNPVAAIGTGLQLGGDIAAYKGQQDANETNYKIAKEQMEFQTEEAATARDYMERMSSTSYQRAMDDMKKAGLNPILAYAQGGASTPTASAPIGASAVMQNPAGHLSNTAGNIAQQMTTASDLNTADKTRQKMESEIKEIERKVDVLGTQYDLNRQQKQHLIQQARNLLSSNAQILETTSGIEAENVQRKQWADFLQGKDIITIAQKLNLSPSLVRTIFRFLNPMK